MLRKSVNVAQRMGDMLRRRNAYATVFKSPDGQVVLRDLLRFSGVLQDHAVPGQADATYYRLGLQRYALRVISILNMSEAEIYRLAQQQEEADRDAVPQES